MSAAKHKADDEIRAIRAKRAKGMKLASIADEHGLSEGAVSRICARKAYATVEDDPDATWTEGEIIHATAPVQ